MQERVTDSACQPPVSPTAEVSLPRSGYWMTISALRWLPTLVFCAIVLAPVVFMVINSFRISLPGEPTAWGLDGWVSVFSSMATLKTMGSTVLLALMRVPLAVVLGAFFTWLLLRTDMPGRGLLEFAFWIAFFMPTLPLAMAWVLLLDPHAGWLNMFAQQGLGSDGSIFNIYSYWGITWVHLTSSSVPVMIILLGPAFRALDSSMEESARMCGARPLAMLRRIVLPLIYPALATAAIAVFIRSLEAFEVELLLGLPAGISVYSTAIRDFAVWDPPRYAEAMALSVPFLAVLLLLAYFYQRSLRGRSFVTMTGKASSAAVLPLGRWRLPAAALCLSFVVVAVVVPVLAFLVGSFMEVYGMVGVDGAFTFTLHHWSSVLNDSLFTLSVMNTLKLGFGAAALGVLFYSLIAYLILRSNLAGKEIINVIIWLPWAIPGILLSLSLLWLFLGTPGLNALYGSLLGLIIAKVFTQMPIGVNLMKASLMQVSGELEDAAKMSGAKWWQMYRRILLPLLAPTCITVGMLTFIAAARDISTVILLSTPQNRPLSVLMLDYATGGLIENAAVIGVIISMLATGVALLGRSLGLNLVKK